MKCDGQLDDAFVEFDFGSSQANVYVAVEVVFDAAALAAWQGAGFSGDFEAIFGGSGYLGAIDINSPPDVWIDGKTGQTSLTPTPTADTTYTIESHYQQNTIVESWVNNTTVGNSGSASFGTATIVLAGLISNPIVTDSVVYVSSVKIGTTRGGTELLFDDFADGTFNAWTSTYGDVSLIPVADVVNRRVKLGMENAIVREPTGVYFDNLKVGMTLGATDYIDEDFTGGF